MAWRMTWITESGTIVLNAHVVIQTLKAKMYNGALVIVSAYNSEADYQAKKPTIEPAKKITISNTSDEYINNLAEAVVKALDKTDTVQGYGLTAPLTGTQTEGPFVCLAGQDFTTAINTEE